MCAKIPAFLAATFTLALWSGIAAAGVGTTVQVVRLTTAAGDTGSRELLVGTDVFMGDLLQSGPVGEAQIVFVDQTRLVVGPNSSLTIDKFIVNPDKTAKELSVNVGVGVFRFITGVSKKDAYALSTPTATIGVRGTKLDIFSSEQSTGVVLYSGEAEVCSRSTGQCILVKAGCGVGVVDSSGASAPSNSIAQAAYLKEHFPYAVDQASLRGDFKVNTGACGLFTVPARIEPQDPPQNIIQIGAPAPVSPQ